jgi:hypothetical protein
MTSTPEQRRNLLYWFMTGDKKGAGDYQGQMKVWIAYLYNIPETSISNIIEQYISTHQTVDRAIEKSGGSGHEGLAHQLFYNPDFFKRLNGAGRITFLEITVEDVLFVVKRFCRRAHCANCGIGYEDITKLRHQGDKFFCTKCEQLVQPDFPKIIVIAKVIRKHADWFTANLDRVKRMVAQQYGIPWPQPVA